ncbi:uncharacterized protein LOC127877697 [Dreissena polymorpha]|uniref:Uncharacterized protein n=1 Tax=Dreissena polymorpha TaxID=45954 RepID=A0A9D4K730_DREPO|nr:uncharacterized protein LOC127877697 [Dreissena polymorpha]KAH3834190.1 hypothetical protein DPMN_107509 [Dreissena polymorpha]
MMWWYKSLGLDLVAIISVAAENYSLTSCATEWRSVPCDLAEPKIKLNNGDFEVEESLDSVVITSDVWIGYLLAKIPFLLLGLVGVVVGVSVGILVAVVGAVVLFCLKRRGKVTCSKTKTLHNKNDEDVLEERSSNVNRIDNSVANQNYFVLEKHTTK